MKNSLFLLFCLALFITCKTETQKYTTTFNKKISDEISIEVMREDNYQQFYGILSGINWSNNHSFHYEFSIKPDDSKWVGADGQLPQKIFFCDKDIYLLAKGEKVLIDTANVNAIPNVIEVSLYYKNVDNRYFFKLFGDQFFEAIDSTKFYTSKINCKEENIPVQ
jgi:hypothetical protein